MYLLQVLSGSLDSRLSFTNNKSSNNNKIEILVEGNTLYVNGVFKGCPCILLYVISFILLQIEAAMAKRSVELLFVLVSCCVYLSMSFADTSCPKVAEGTAPCSDDEDKKIMDCCLESYKLGFDNLAEYVPGKDPPSCAVDLVSVENTFVPINVPPPPPPSSSPPPGYPKVLLEAVPHQL